jgi:hypothetical protein
MMVKMTDLGVRVESGLELEFGVSCSAEEFLHERWHQHGHCLGASVLPMNTVVDPFCFVLGCTEEPRIRPLTDQVTQSDIVIRHNTFDLEEFRKVRSVHSFVPGRQLRSDSWLMVL